MNSLKKIVKNYAGLFGFIGLLCSPEAFLQGVSPHYQVVVYPDQITYAQPDMFDVAEIGQPYVVDSSYPGFQTQNIQNTTTPVVNVPVSPIVEPGRPAISSEPVVPPSELVVSSEPVKKSFVEQQASNLTTWAKNHPLEALATAVLLAKTAHGVKQFSDEVGIKNTLETAAATAQHKIKRRIEKVINNAEQAAHARFE